MTPGTNKRYGGLILALCLSLSACATIISGSTQKIRVTSVPDLVSVTVQPGDHQAQTPADLILPRGGGPYSVKFEKEGYTTVELKLDSINSEEWVFLNYLLGGFVGIMIDHSTGAAYSLMPDKLHVFMVNTKPNKDITE